MLVPLRRTQWYPVWPVMDRSTNLSVILIYKKKKKKIVNNHTNINKRSNHLSYL